ncbi:MAG: phage tail tape measure protein [Rhizobiaceae bacterium]|nr:phage tail tape measure protein [Rhizobiaceae bacterium]
MSDLDVSLRLRLVNQLSRPAEEAERDLKELQRAAERLGRTRGSDQLGADIRKVGAAAADAKTKLGGISEETEQLRQKLGRLNATRGLDGLKQDAGHAKQAIASIGTEADELRRKLGQIGDVGFAELKQDAASARQAIENIGTAASQASGKIELLDDTSALSKLRDEAKKTEDAIRNIGAGGQPLLNDPAKHPAGRGVGAPVHTPGTGGASDPTHTPGSGRAGRAAEGFADRSGLDAYVPFGVSGSYAAGAGIAAGGVAAYRATKKYAGFDREMRMLGNAAGVKQDDVEGSIPELRAIAQEIGVPADDILEAFRSRVTSTGEWRGSLDQMRDIGRTAKTSGASSEDVVNTFLAAERSLGFTPDKLSKASDIMIEGGNSGQFEMRDMANYLPGLLSLAGSKGYQGEGGLASLIASLQIIARRSGGNDNAARQLGEVLGKMDAEETANNFKDFKVDLPKRIKDGKARGEDPVNIVLDAVEEAIKGDKSKITRLFREKDSQLGILNLLADREERDRLAEDLQGASGATERDFQRVKDDPQSRFDRADNALSDAWMKFGAFIDRIGGTKVLEGFANVLDIMSADTPGTVGNLRNLLGLAPSENSDDLVALQGRRDQLTRDLSEVNIGPQSGGAGFERAALMAELEEVLKQIAAETARLKAISDADPELGPVPGRGAKQTLPATMPVPLGKPMGPAAEQSMESYNDALQAQGQEAIGIAQGIADSIRAMLGFTVSPTIQPRLVGPKGGGGQAGGAGNGGAPRGTGGRQTASLAPVNNYNIRTSNPQVAARRVQAEQNRQVRLAQWNAIGDMGSAFG